MNTHTIVLKVIQVINTRFLFRPAPKHGESLTSYLLRISKINVVSPHDLWRLLLPQDSHYPQSSMSSILDLNPYAVLQLRDFEFMLGIEKTNLEMLTFMPVFRALGVTNISRSKILSGLTDSNRKYCPKCLKETPVYKLIWQVKEITWCDKHNIRLLSKCWKCNKDIPLLPSKGVVGLCPSCSSPLKNAPVKNVEGLEVHLRIKEDWEFLLNSINNFKPIKDLTTEQTLALKIIFLAQSFEKLKGYNFRSLITPILQIARKSKTTQTFIHLSTILHLLRTADVSFKDFAEMEIPKDFIESILKHDSRMVDQYSCLAPWCEGYLKPGTLKRTATSTKKRKDGNTYNYYMYCSKCGLEYCLNKDKKIVERGNFISFAWEKLWPKIDDLQTLRQFASNLGSTVDKTRRAIVFLAANNLIKSENLPIEVPNTPNPELISTIIDLINLGLPAKQICNKLKVTYNQFLYHWFMPLVQISYFNRKKTRISQCTGSLKRRKAFESAIDYFLRNNKTITIQAVTKYLGICPETLRLWGLLTELKKAKKSQQEIRHKKYEACIKQFAEEIIRELQVNSEPVTSKEVYKRIGRSRNSIVRSHPQVTQHITQLITNDKNGHLI